MGRCTVLLLESYPDPSIHGVGLKPCFAAVGSRRHADSVEGAELLKEPPVMGVIVRIAAL